MGSQVSSQLVLPVFSFTPFTMLDYPGKIACIIWFAGCNMRCAYCHNPQIVKGKGEESLDRIMTFLAKRRGLLDGVVLSGGEATLYPDLLRLIQSLKSMDYAVKLDTNGLHPDILEALLKEGLLNYIALDYKAPPSRFKQVTGTDKYKLFNRSLSILCEQKTLPFEIRTTVHTDVIAENELQWIIDDLDERGFNGTYAIQNYRHNADVPTLGRMPPQKRIVSTAMLHSTNFNIEFRNF